VEEVGFVDVFVFHFCYLDGGVPKGPMALLAFGGLWVVGLFHFFVIFTYKEKEVRTQKLLGPGSSSIGSRPVVVL